jgi:2-hydroxy-6-oxonona-2,4-dienedioate hydrolase
MITTAALLETVFDHPERIPDRFIIADGYRTHYLEAGDASAPPLVLVHGSSCEIGMGVDRWYPTVLPLSRQFHVIAVDELGHGQTDPPRNLGDLGHVRVRAEHVIAFLDALGIGPVHLVGQSQGGWIVTYITIKRPDLVKRLVLIDSGSVSGSSVATSEGLPYMKNVFESGTRIPKHDLTTREGIRTYVGEFCFNKAMITDPLLDRLCALSERWNSLYMQRIRNFWSENGLERQRAMYAVDGVHISEHVHTVQRPTLVIWGKLSNKGVDPGVELYKQIPGAQMHIFDQANHFVWLDQPHDFNSLVTWFLSRR